MSIYEVLSNSSRELFWGLEEGQKRILRYIAESGPLNITELGKRNSRYTITGFDRWGVLKRINGSYQFPSLLEYDYLYEMPVNKKETKYGLTLKGLMFALESVAFEQNYVIKQYRKFLKKWLKKTKDVERIIEFVKIEIAYVLYYNTLEGINWKKFKSIPPYFEKERIPDKAERYHLYFDVEHLKLDKIQQDKISEILRAYRNIHHWCWSDIHGSLKLKKLIEPEQVFRAWKKVKLKGSKLDQVIITHIIFNIYCRYWNFYLIDPNFSATIDDLVWKYFQIRGFDLRPKILNMKKKDRDKLLANKEISKLFSSMFTAIRIN